MKKIEQILQDYKASVAFLIIIAVIIIVFLQNTYLSTHLEECRTQNELYKQNPPRIEIGTGGYDNWESSIKVN